MGAGTVDTANALPEALLRVYDYRLVVRERSIVRPP
jgi:hypothetical protein